MGGAPSTASPSVMHSVVQHQLTSLIDFTKCFAGPLALSRNNALLGSKRLMFSQRMAYLNVGIYPFTSVFLIVYCFLPALSIFSGQFIVQTLNVTFLVYLLIITICLVTLAILEVKWSGVGLEEWWRNEQFWLISGTSSHLAAVVQGLLKVIAGIEISHIDFKVGERTLMIFMQICTLSSGPH